MIILILIKKVINRSAMRYQIKILKTIMTKMMIINIFKITMIITNQEMILTITMLMMILMITITITIIL